MHISLAEELSELLQISLDSVYRRLRCETDITLTETFAICKHFNIPLEALSEVNSNMVAFRINKLTADSESFYQYLQVLHGDLSWMMKYPNHKLIYAAEDLPVFYHFFFPKLAQFKNDVLEQKHPELHSAPRQKSRRNPTALHLARRSPKTP
jgi:hypothetical protein